jgi:RNA polymerase sigma factor (TIGR02999 family)
VLNLGEVFVADVTRILACLEQGDPTAAESLLPLVYAELRGLAAEKLAREKPGQTLQATALVHEAYLRLVDRSQVQLWNSRGHFLMAAAEAMRRILIERARHKNTQKAGGRYERADLPDIAAPADPTWSDVLALNEALSKLEQKDRRKAELVKLRFFAGLSGQEAARILGISLSTADNDWAYARAWLRLEMGGGPADCS